MALLKSLGYTIAGLSACVPQNTFRVSDFAFKNDIERNDFISRVGVSEKRIAPEGTTASDLCVKAAEDLISDLNWDKEEIELLVFVTQTPDHLIPFGSAAIQHRLGLNNNCACFDFHTGCSGWVYGLSFIYGFMQAYRLKKALLLCGETSHIVSAHDKTTFPLIGDAGTATAITHSDSELLSFFNLQSFGKESAAITIADGGARSPVSEASLISENFGEGINRNRLHSSMDGQKILEFSLTSVPKNIEELLSFAGLNIAEIDFLVLHQANKILCEAVRKKLRAEASKTPYSLSEYGNTSSASIPLTLVTRLKETLLQGPNQILTCGFGVGLSAASAVLPLPKLNSISYSEL